MDTIKTRLQSGQGFRAAGGFRGIYAGVGSAALGAAPGAALFFVTYERIKAAFQGQYAETSRAESIGHMIAASVGEVAACAVRVPTEVVKQRAQAKQHPGSLAALQAILVQRHLIGNFAVLKELYRGWTITVVREVPFTVIQFPLWEAMKKSWRVHRGRDTSTALESAVFGSVAGALAAAITTPLDVLKTRMMLSTEAVKASVMLTRIIRKNGPQAFFAGIGPRVLWISVGGFVFLGSYQLAQNALAHV